MANTSDIPSFKSRDPLSPEFWDERFERDFTPWDLGGVPQALRTFVERNPAPRTALIPGCGNGYELTFLSEAGWNATAIDFSPAAVQRARRLVGQWAERVEEADFFAWQPQQPLELIYERAFLCALPSTMRPQVAARYAELLPADGLLAGFFFFGSAPKGPPFAIPRSELEALLAPHFELVEEGEVVDSLPVFGGQERWMVWRRR
ncbi:methyltransferase [Massilia suwonensis]|uniref:Methyltransferase n=1 Tax=Massilia suwonensis TaxID=648895 RepID=A0ABW0MTP8_9BURK